MLQVPSSLRPFAQALWLTAAGTFTLVGAGCAQQGPVYGWSHPAGGEYLFAFDLNECSARAPSAAEADQAFFDCMKDRGYLRVDPASGAVLAEEGEAIVLTAPGFTQAGR